MFSKYEDFFFFFYLHNLDNSHSKYIVKVVETQNCKMEMDFIVHIPQQMSILCRQDRCDTLHFILVIQQTAVRNYYQQSSIYFI